MSDSGMPRDSRVHKGRGRYETRYLGVTAAGNTNYPLIGANGARVALILSADITAPLADDWAEVGPLVSGAVHAVSTLTCNSPRDRLSIETHGDVIMQGMVVNAPGTVLGVHAWEVIWHPEEL